MSATTDPDRDGGRFSVIITNWNYGHFLEECICSVLAQTSKAHEIIVVDDGSTDGSDAVLAAFGTNVKIIRQENSGQASAMERGFYESTGDIVLFLDADDLLKPVALETIERYWNPDFAAMGFGLDLIDREGRTCGSYDVQLLAGDMRPLLLMDSVFPFMPTSGNAFNRRALERIFPIPHQRWRICADAILVRGAALWGEIRPIPVSLGCYRNHNANNYFRETAPLLWATQRGLGQLADASLYFSERTAHGGISEPDLGVSRQLRLAELNTRAKSYLLHDRKTGLAPALLRAIGAELRKPTAPHSFRYASLYAALIPGFWRKTTWLERPTRPCWLDRLFFTWLGKNATAARRAAIRPRFQPEAPFNERLIGLTWKDLLVLSLHDWRHDEQRGAAWLCGTEGAIYLKPQFSARPLRIACKFEVTEAWADMPVDVFLVEAGDVSAAVQIHGSGMLEYVLPAERTYANEVIEFRIRVTPGRPGAWRNLFRPAAIVRLVDLSIYPSEPECTGVHLPVGVPVAFETIAGGCLAQGRVKNNVEDGDFVEDGFATLRFRLPASTLEPVFRLCFGGSQAKGWLLVKWNDRFLFDGEIGADAEVAFGCPMAPKQPWNAIDLAISFAPDDEFEEKRIFLESVCHVLDSYALISPPASSAEHRRNAMLCAGQQVIPANDDVSRRIFSLGWVLDPFDGAIVRDSSAMIEFVTSPKMRGEARLLLDLVPRGGFHGEADGDFIVSIGVGDQPVAQVNLQGPHTLEIPLPRSDGAPDNLVRLLIHAVGLGTGGVTNPRPGGLSVTKVALAGKKSARANRTANGIVPAQGSIHSEIVAAARLAREEAESGLPSERTEDFLRRHERIVGAFRRLTRSAVVPTLAHAGVFSDLVEIGRCFRSIGPAAADDDHLPDWTGEEAMRNFAIAVLSRPAWRCKGAETIYVVPPFAAAFPDAVAAYLAEPPPVPASEPTLLTYCDYVTALYRSCRNLFQREYAGSRYFVLAEQTFRRIQPNRLLFGALNLRRLAAAEGAARQTLLQISGSGPAFSPPPPSLDGRPTRLAVVIRNLSPGPETWLLFGMCRGLNKDRFRTTLYVLEHEGIEEKPESIFDDVMSLDGLTIDQAVAAIRAGDHDAMLLGSYPGGEGPLSALVAHRLARRQIATTAVCPRTTGLASFDVMLSSKLTEPANAEGHYCEELHLWDEPVQCFDFGAAAPAARSSPFLGKRSKIGLPRDRTILVSGAMANKIGEDLATAWARILADCPQATLVLYPFAKNWRQRYAKSRFQQELSRIFEANSVAADQLVILDDLSSVGVRDLLSGSDLYLDSFPYAGATTIVEALGSGLPVATFSGSMQRGLQGAGWLRAYGLSEGIAETVDGYVSLATQLVKDKDARLAYRRRILGSLAERTDLNDPAVFGKRFGAWLSKLVTRDAS